jgi:hypothetical protein
MTATASGTTLGLRIRHLFSGRRPATRRKSMAQISSLTALFCLPFLLVPLYHFGYISSDFSYSGILFSSHSQGQTVVSTNAGEGHIGKVKSDSPAADMKSSSVDDEFKKFAQDTFEWYKEGRDSGKQLIFSKVTHIHKSFI